jgi:hypothetical protein
MHGQDPDVKVELIDGDRVKITAVDRYTRSEIAVIRCSASCGLFLASRITDISSRAKKQQEGSQDGN